MEDPQRRPGDRDREQVTARINRAASQGLIGVADRDIRLGNVGSAQTMAELDLMNRDLDQLEATLPARPTDTPPTPTPTSAPTPAQPPAQTPAQSPAPAPWSTFDPEATHGGATSGRGGLVLTLVVVAVVAVVIAGVTAAIGLAGSGDPDSGSVSEPRTVQPATPDPATRGPVSGQPRPTYALTARGIRGFLMIYRQRFGTSRVVELTLYEQYAIVGVPVPGKDRQESWLYRPAAGFSSFGGVRATFPGAQVVDTRRLAVAPLVRNIARARNRLNVERPAQAYVIVRYYRPPDEAPGVDIHVANKFNESGYLATRLDGTVERAFPYAR